MIESIRDLIGKWFALTDGKRVETYRVTSIIADKLVLLGQQCTKDGSYRFEKRSLEETILWDTKDEAIKYIKRLIEENNTEPEKNNENSFNLEEVLREMIR